MPLNLLKTYPLLLDLGHLNDQQRTQSLQGIFKRDIEENPQLNFRAKTIRPIKGEEPAMVILFRHLTTEEIVVEDENGKQYPKRIFEMARSQRLHWIRYHLEEKKNGNVEVFSVEERDQKKRKDIIRTYIYDMEQKYIIVLDPQRTQKDYYLITAYHLNKEFGEKKIKKLMNRRLPELY
jgi:hypothetical protein